jgi:hypothetical protein
MGRAPGQAGAGPTESEPYAEEAHQFIKEMCLQREVSVEFDTVDRNGNFIGLVIFGLCSPRHAIHCRCKDSRFPISASFVAGSKYICVLTREVVGDTIDYRCD